MKLILVDDEKFAVQGLKDMLNWKSFDGELIGTASNGQEALSLIAYNQPDVVISDIKMPIMDGLALARTISEQYKHIDLILLSAHGEFEYARQAIEYQVTNYILKPITRDKINNLEQLLISINQKRQYQKEEFLTIWDDTFKNNILEGLRQNNIGTFDKLFSSSLFDFNISMDSYNTLGSRLIHFLYAYLSELHIHTEILSSSKHNTLNEYWDLPSKQEKLNYLITKYYDVLSTANILKHSNTDSIITIANQYILEHFYEPNFNISYLANTINVSISYLSTTFKQAMGTNLSTYIITLRLNKAKALLLDFKYAISDIAPQCGYEDSKYFAKLFKKKTGVTPTEYRNIHIQNTKFL